MDENAILSASEVSAEDAAFKPGDVVELRSGSFPMVVTDLYGDDVQRLHLVWDLNGVMSGRAGRLSRACLPASACKIFIPYDERGEKSNIPF